MLGPVTSDSAWVYIENCFRWSHRTDKYQVCVGIVGVPKFAVGHTGDNHPAVLLQVEVFQRT